MRAMAKAGWWAGPGRLLKKSELLFRWIQLLKKHRFHYHTSTGTIEDFLRILESLLIICTKSQIYQLS